MPAASRPPVFPKVRFPILAIVLAAMVAVTAVGSARADAFTPAQRAEIVAIMRDALQHDPSILRDAIASMAADDARVHDAAARTAITTARPALLDGTGDPTAGNPNGTVTVVEFYDTRCPYCRRMLPTIAALLKQDPSVRLVYKDLPILGPDSVVESRALLAAQKQGGYLALQSILMSGNATPTPAILAADARRAGLDPDRLLTDMADPAIGARLDANIALARQLDIDGTPALVIGDRMIPGAVDLDQLQSAIRAARAR